MSAGMWEGPQRPDVCGERMRTREIKARKVGALRPLPHSMPLFVTGTDTGVGKTFVTAALVRELRRTGVHAGAVKPFATGSREDARVLRAAMDGELTLEEINPVFFRRPLAPAVAARLEGRRVPLRVREASGKREAGRG
ncbi:MAG: dethiobiotin synthase, partial [Verrucomicrobia bacterium]|nr:dethiobiotin synthase [Verrucomicrobiota bacterium]